MALETTAGFQSIRGDVNIGKADELSYTEVVESVRDVFKTGKTKDIAWRKNQLKQLKKLISENHARITEAILADHSGPKLRGTFDFTGAMDEISLFEKNIDKWAGIEVVKHDSLLGKSYVRKEPKGVVLIIAPWNFPFAMVLDPLIPVLAAGNCAVIKPSEVSVNSCKLIEELIPKYMDPSAVKVVTGGVEETTALLREKFDHIMYTGNGHVGRIVMTAAAKHLTPVTLELGGKSPTYVDKSAKVQTAVERVFMSKLVNSGQICVAPDYVLVHKDIAEEFKNKMVAKIKAVYGSTLEENKAKDFYPKIINSRHAERITKLIQGTTGKILTGGSSDTDNRYVAATVIDNPSLNDTVLKEEIFGPVLPIIEVGSVEEAAEKVNKICDQPLALYVFAEDQKALDYFLDHTSSGGCCVNTTLEHLTNHHLPFGGIGESGMGKYHGKWGFDEFSHARAVLQRDTRFIKGPAFPPPPYNKNLYDLAVKLKVTGFLTDAQKGGLKVAGAGVAAVTAWYLFQSKL